MASGLVRGEVRNRVFIPISGTEISVSTILPDREMIADCEAVAGWTALSNDTTGIAVAPEHLLGTQSLEYDKVDGADNEKFGGVYKTIASLDCSRFTAEDHLTAAFNVTSIALIDYAFIRLGTDASNYNEWRLADTLPIVVDVWQMFDVPLAETIVAVTGNGWNPSAITYVVLGVMFDAQANALADVRWDHLMIRSAQLTTT